MVDFIDYEDPNTTLIQSDTIIQGNLKTNGSLELLGTVKGNVESDSLVSVYGKIEGNVDSRDFIGRDNSQINGDVALLYDGFVGINCQLNGNVNCKNIEICGNIVGNITAENSVIIRSSASVAGDITCQSLVVDHGGRINGNVQLIYKYL